MLKAGTLLRKKESFTAITGLRKHEHYYTVIDPHAGSHQGPVAGSGVKSFCPHHSHTGLSTSPFHMYLCLEWETNAQQNKQLHKGLKIVEYQKKTQV